MANDRTAPGGMGMLLLALLEGRDMYGYEMIEAYHGDIRVESEPGVGTSFFLSFRREPLPAPKEEP